jgi:hypothetical protein
MLQSKLVTTGDELFQIHELNQKNLRGNLAGEIQRRDGFVSWLYPIKLLEQMHSLAAAVIVKDGDTVAGYALTTLKEASAFHPDLQTMFSHLSDVRFKDRLLSAYDFLLYGTDMRGQGIPSQRNCEHALSKAQRSVQQTIRFPAYRNICQ